MASHKRIDRICCLILALTLLVTVLFMCSGSLGVQKTTQAKGYVNRLFDTSKVHTIDIVMDDWDGFLASCTDEEYVPCNVVIDGESRKNVAIRAKGNTSLTNVMNYGNNRYGFKLEFDHYDASKTYHGLDKLSLNNIIQDNTYMKDYLCYRMMAAFGVAAPLTSFAQIRVNGEEWGLYLAVEGVEEAFLERNYGKSYGALYKPDSQKMGGGRGNGGKFNMDDWDPETEFSDFPQSFGKNRGEITLDQVKEMLNGLDEALLPQAAEALGYDSVDDMREALEAAKSVTDFLTGQDIFALIRRLGGQFGGKGGFQPGNMPGGMGSDDVKLVYTDDEFSSYSNIFDSAKTNVSDEDKARLISSLKSLNEQENLADVVDVDRVIRYFVVHNFVCNFDSYTGSMIHNYYLYEQDGRLSMIPWDYNLAFGGFGGAPNAASLVNFPVDSPVSGGTTESRPMLAWIFANAEYTEKYHRYFQEFISEYFDSGYFGDMMAAVKAMIAPYVESDPTKFCTYEEFLTGFDTLTEFCRLRAQSVSGQLAGTIPATSQGQSADGSALIDASGLNISDMGSMNAGGMGGPGLPGDGSGEMPTPPDGQMPDGFPGGGDGQQFGGFPGGQMPGNFPGDGQQDSTQQPGNFPGGMGSFPGGQMPDGQMPGNFPGGMGGFPSGQMPDENSQMPDGFPSGQQSGGMGQRPGNMESFQPGNMSSFPGGQMPDGNSQQPNSGRGDRPGGGNMPEGFPGDRAPAQNGSVWLWFAACCAVLLAGLAAAFLYRKKA